MSKYSFSTISKKHRDECCTDLQIVLNRAICTYDFSVICGHRDELTQNKAFKSGFSRVAWPNGKHNTKPSEAFDIYPYHKTWGVLTGHPSQVAEIVDKLDMTYLEVEAWITQEFCIMAGVILATASAAAIALRWGGDWDGDGDRLDQRFDDLAHFEKL